MKRPRFLLPALTLALLAATAPGQKLFFAGNDGPDFKDNTSMGGPNLLLGIKFQAPASVPVFAIEVFTGEQAGPNSVAIWDHVAATNMPGKELAKGSWTMWRENSWQGAVLSLPVLLTQNQDYWVVWGCINGSQTSQANTGSQSFYYRGSFDAGKSWNGPAAGWGPSPWKFRLYLPSAPGTFTKVGSGVPGAGAITPILEATGWAVRGNEITLRVIDPAPAVPALIIGGLPVAAPIGPWTAYALPPLLVLAATTASGKNPGDGDFPKPIPIPDNPALIGLQASFQAWIVDPAGPLGLAHTNGLTVLIQ